MKFVYVLGQSPHNLNTTIDGNAGPTIFHTQNVRCHVWKTIRTTLQCIVVLKSWGDGRKNFGISLCPYFLAFWTFSPRFENNSSLQCSSDNFPYMVAYILCLENCQNCILMHSFLPIAGILSKRWRW